jgi:hypothetical protein
LRLYVKQFTRLKFLRRCSLRQEGAGCEGIALVNASGLRGTVTIAAEASGVGVVDPI